MLLNTHILKGLSRGKSAHIWPNYESMHICVTLTSLPHCLMSCFSASCTIESSNLLHICWSTCINSLHLCFSTAESLSTCLVVSGGFRASLVLFITKSLSSFMPGWCHRLAVHKCPREPTTSSLCFQRKESYCNCTQTCLYWGYTCTPPQLFGSQGKG